MNILEIFPPLEDPSAESPDVSRETKLGTRGLSAAAALECCEKNDDSDKLDQLFDLIQDWRREWNFNSHDGELNRNELAEGTSLVWSQYLHNLTDRMKANSGIFGLSQADWDYLEPPVPNPMTVGLATPGQWSKAKVNRIGYRGLGPTFTPTGPLVDTPRLIRSPAPTGGWGAIGGVLVIGWTYLIGRTHTEDATQAKMEEIISYLKTTKRKTKETCEECIRAALWRQNKLQRVFDGKVRKRV